MGNQETFNVKLLPEFVHICITHNRDVYTVLNTLILDACSVTDTIRQYYIESLQEYIKLRYHIPSTLAPTLFEYPAAVANTPFSYAHLRLTNSFMSFCHSLEISLEIFFSNFMSDVASSFWREKDRYNSIAVAARNYFAPPIEWPDDF